MKLASSPDHPAASAEFSAVAFPELSAAQLAALAVIGTRRTFADGESLFRTGGTDLSMHVVISGEAEVFDQHNGGETVLGTAGERDFLGDVAMLTGGRRWSARGPKGSWK